MKTTHRFPIGAWVRDPMHDRLTHGGLEQDSHGRYHFKPSSGEITMLLGPKPWPAYKIIFGGCENIIFADKAECRECSTLDDTSHEDGCMVAPGGYLRIAPHTPGFAPD